MQFERLILEVQGLKEEFRSLREGLIAPAIDKTGVNIDVFKLTNRTWGWVTGAMAISQLLIVLWFTGVKPALLSKQGSDFSVEFSNPMVGQNARENQLPVR